MSTLLLNWLCLFLLLPVINAIQIQTPQGNIRGVTKLTFNERRFHAFLGIPFAKPPVGELRFRNPLPFGSWKDVRDATQDGEECPHFGGVKGINGTIGSEDCLYLNVFTPNALQKNKYPVMFYIYGGAFALDSGTTFYYGPDFLLDKDIVLVVTNYRLGALGFASMEDGELPGNYGLKDIALALKWVHENIEAYGGNPEKITVSGASSGAASVHYQMLSPLSKDLFHRAILMSGSAHCTWAIRPKGAIAKRTRKLASLLDCPSKPSSALTDCLRQVPYNRFVDVYNTFKVWDIEPVVVFGPVVEPKGTPGAFITEDPLKLKTSIPIMTGVTKNEGGSKVAIFTKSGLELRLSQLNDNFTKIAPLALSMTDNTKNPVSIFKKIRQFYFGKNKINVKTIPNLINMITDGSYFQCMTSTIRSHQGPVYLYMLVYRGTWSFSEYHTHSNKSYGVCHGDDVQYLFPFEPFTKFFERKAIAFDDLKAIHKMTELWTNFAIHGNPTPEGSDVIWSKVKSPNQLNYLSIDATKLKMEHYLWFKRDKFWKTLNWRK